jgi:uncharacterized protein YwgA/O-acetyl-ADP-ribose deacetylase (regulator of RNase III)
MTRITVRTGNLLESKAQTLVNTVNTVGVMGKGVALQFREAFPDMFKDYVRRCEAHMVRLGEPYLYKRLVPPWILNFPTKDHWRSVTKLADVERGLEYLKRHYRKWEIMSLAVPPLGCGLGGLEWRVVGPVLYRHLSELDIPVELYAPFGTPHEELQLGADAPAAPAPKVDAAWIALVEILRRVEERPYHWPVGRVAFQKVAYFATAVGIPTRLEYTRGSYGPFAADLTGVISRLANNGLIVEQRRGAMLNVQVGPTYTTARRAYDAELARWQAAMDAVVDLFVRLSTHRAELAATVHFVYESIGRERGARPTVREILAGVMAWKIRRRPPIREQDVLGIIRSLAALGWIDPKPTGDALEFDEDDADLASSGSRD